MQVAGVGRFNGARSSGGSHHLWRQRTQSQRDARVKIMVKSKTATVRVRAFSVLFCVSWPRLVRWASGNQRASLGRPNGVRVAQ